MTAIGSATFLALDQVKATALAAKVPLLAQRAPTPPAPEQQIEAGRRVVQAAKAEAATAAEKVQADRDATHPRGIVV